MEKIGNNDKKIETKRIGRRIIEVEKTFKDKV